MKRRFRSLCLLLAWGAGCAWFAPDPPPGWRSRLASPPPIAGGGGVATRPEALERLVRQPDLEILGVEGIGSGITGSVRIKVHHPSVGTIDVKWRAAPDGGAGWNNSPRRELAAYEIQKWFLEPDEYVVPPTAGACIPAEKLPEELQRPPTFPETRCVFGTFALWLHGVAPPDVLLDRSQFYDDPSYAWHLGSFNLLTYLIENRDTRTSNILVSKDASTRRVFSIDNGISFGERFWNPFVLNWNVIRVPALPRERVDRLRRVRASDLDALLVVAQFRRDPEGTLRATAPSAAIEPDAGVTFRDGTLQLGLRPREIAGVRERLHDLIRAVDAGEHPVF